MYVFLFFFADFFVKAYVVGTQMGTHNICLFKEVDKKYLHGYNLKTTELLDWALIGVCAVIRMNMVSAYLIGKEW